MRARSGAVTAGAAGDLARGDVAVASLVQMSASDRAGAVASPAEETPGDASVGRAAGDRRDAGREPASVARGARCFSARVFDRSFNGSSFDAHDGPVRCCRAVPRSNDCQTVADTRRVVGSCWLSINQPFIVLTETKFSYRYIPVWAPSRYSPHRTRVEAHANMLSP